MSTNLVLQTLSQRVHAHIFSGFTSISSSLSSHLDQIQTSLISFSHFSLTTTTKVINAISFDFSIPFHSTSFRSISPSISWTTHLLFKQVLPSFVSGSATRSTFHPSGPTRVSTQYFGEYQLPHLAQVGRMVSLRLLAEDPDSSYMLSHSFHSSKSESQPHWTVRAVRRGVARHTLHVYDDGRVADSFDNGGKHWKKNWMHKWQYLEL